MHMKSALSSAAALIACAAVLTACGPDTGPSAEASASTPPAAASSAPASTHPATPPSPSAPAAGGTSTSPAGSGSGGSGGADATSDSYAYHHPCTSSQLSLRLVRRATAPTQRVIEVRNLGTRSCGLSYYPKVGLYNGDSATGDPSVDVEVPDGLGGPPATPVYAGQTLYAVVDLDPSGDTQHAVDMINTMNVLPDGDHMSSRYTRIFRLSAEDHVLHPKLGLYDTTVARAVESVDGVSPTP